MQESDVAGLLREGMLVTLYVGGPPLLAVTLVVLGSFMMATLTTFTHTLFDRLVAVGGQ
jgi:flagellar biosynthesis protein FliQ